MQFLKAVIFDQDGVLVNTEPIMSQAYSKVLKNHSITYELRKDGLVQPIGVRSDVVLRYFKQKYLLNIDRDTFRTERNLWLFKYIKAKKIVLMPGVLNLLKNLKKNNIKIVLATGSAPKLVKHFIRKLEIEKYFDIILTGADFKKSKPSPEIYLLALKKLGVNSKSCIVIEDSIAGIKAASAAKIKVLVVGAANKTSRGLALAVKNVNSLVDVRTNFLQKLLN